MNPGYPTISPIFSIERCRYPTSGIAFFRTSPSVSTMKLMTPWVDGCCGPKLRTISSLSRSTRRRMSFSMSFLSGLRGGVGLGRRRLLRLRRVVEPLQLDEWVLADVRDAVPAARLLVVLAERVADPVVGEHDPAEVRVAREVHAEEVVHLALEPVRGLPDHLDRGDRRRGAVRLDLQLEDVPVLVREQVVDDLDLVLLRPVDRGEVLEEVEVEPGLRLEEPRDLDDPLALHYAVLVDLGLGERADVIAEPLLEPLMDLMGRHFVPLMRFEASRQLPRAAPAPLPNTQREAVDVKLCRATRPPPCRRSLGASWTTARSGRSPGAGGGPR